MLRELEDTIRQHEGVSLERFLEAGDAFDCGVENMEKGAFRQAVIDFRESLRIKPDAPQAYGNLGICYGKLGMKDQALAMLDRALEIDPDYEPARWNRAGIDKLTEPDADVEVASIQYSAARHAESEERAQGRTGARAGPVTRLLNYLRHQGGPDR
jgi:tetratricopeptide (TPR) repeat protein